MIRPRLTIDSCASALMLGFLFITFTRSSTGAAAVELGSLEKYYIVAALIALVGAALAGRGRAYGSVYGPTARAALLVAFLLAAQTVIVGPGSTDFMLTAVAAGGLYLVLFPSVLNRNRAVFGQALDAYIAASVAMLVVQVAVHRITGQFLDIHLTLHPWSRATEYFAFGQARYSGWFLEPGNYANIVGFLTLVALRLRGGPRPLYWVALVTLPLTNSFSGLFYGVLLAAALLSVQYARLQARTLIPVLGLALFMLTLGRTSGGDARSYYAERLAAQSGTGDGSAFVKQNNVLAFRSFDPVRQITGVPFGVNDCRYCLFVNSNGLLFHALFFFGVFGAAVALIPAVQGRSHLASVPFLAIVVALFMTRYSLLTGPGWAMYALTSYVALSSAPARPAAEALEALPGPAGEGGQR